MLFTLVFSKDYTRVNFKKLKIDKQELLDILSVGIPSGIQGITFSITNILARIYILKLGEVYVSGQTIYVSLSEFPMAITTSLLRTSVAFTSQNYGAKNYKFIRKVQLTILLICMILISICSTLFMVFRFYLISIYTSAPEVIKVADLCFKVCVPYLFLWGLSEVSIGCSKGLNSKKVPMFISLIGICGFRILYLLFYFPINSSYLILLMVYPLSWAITSIAQTIWFEIKYKKIKNSSIKGEVYV